MMDDFPRIRRLPPYIFSITDQLKREARARGEDIIDFGMGNPDQPTPQHIVDKLVETVQRGDTHRYSQSKGIPRLRKAISDWYKKRFDVDLDPESEAIVTLGSKEGIAHLAMAVLGPGDTVLVIDEGNGARQVLDIDPGAVRAVIVGVVDEVFIKE